MTTRTKEDFRVLIAALAQSIINIDSGLETIERGSRVYQALKMFSQAVQEDDIRFRVDGELHTWRDLNSATTPMVFTADELIELRDLAAFAGEKFNRRCEPLLRKLDEALRDVS